MFEDFGRSCAGSIPDETYYAHDDWDRRTENICEEDMEVGERARPLHVDDPRLGRRVDPRRRGRALPRQWQRVLFIELDRSRPRRWLCKVVGS